MKILFIGDIVGRPGRRAIRELLPQLKSELQPDLVIVNGENMASGAGLTTDTYREILEYGVDFMTTGDHIWDKPDIYPILETKSEKLIRPANYPSQNPGSGVADIMVGKERVRIINMQGNVFMRANLESPFTKIDELLTDDNRPKITFVDLHAEATSEKIAFTHYVDGRVSAVIGTHTHVPTNDARILAGGTAAQTDAGMTGPRDGVIGEDKDLIIGSYLNSMPWKHEIADGAIQLNGVLIAVDEATGKATAIETIRREIESAE
jgi:metallophosphoesterase (TIGR00282 family)